MIQVIDEIIICYFFYTFYNSSKISSRFVNITVKIIHCSYIYIYIKKCVLVIQYIYTKTFVHGVFGHILKVVDAC